MGAVVPKSVVAPRARYSAIGHAWRWYLLLGVAASLIYWLSPAAPARLFIWPALGWSSVAAILIGVRIHKPQPRTPWLFLAAGTAMFIYGDNLHTLFAQISHNADPTFPSFVDVVYLAKYPFMIIGLSGLVRERTRSRDWAAVIDAIIVAGAVGLLAWVLVVSPYLSAGMTSLGRLTSIAYPLGDVALLAVTVRLAVGGGGRSRAFILLAVPVISLIVADSLYGYLNLMGQWHPHNPVEAGWIVFYLGWGAAALHPSMGQLAAPVSSEPAVRSTRVVFVGAYALLPPLILIFQQLSGGITDGAAIGVAAIALFSLVLVRIAGLSREFAERQGEARFRSLVQHASDATLVLDPNGVITYKTPSAPRVLGYNPGELEGRALGDLLHPADGEKLRQLLMHPDQSQLVEWRLKTADGDWRYLDVVTADLRGEPSVGGVALTVRDSTERKRLSTEREEALMRANEASRQKSVFLANMSHEIRTPLNGVMGMLGLLTDSDLAPQQRDYADTMAASAESLAAIVNDVLDISQIEAGRLDVDHRPFALRRAIDAAVAVSASSAELKGVELVAVVDEDVPTVVLGDRLRLRQVLNNLVSNATKFTDDGEIVLRVRRDGARVRFEVADTGIGISPSLRDRLFEPYVQADDSTTRRHGGSGLGLTICKQLVGLMGGEIGVESHPGRGSTFWFTVLLGAVEPADGLDMSRERLANVRALVVSTQPALRMSLTSMLSEWELQVSSASDSASALTCLADAASCGNPVAVVVVDVNLGGTAQLELVARMRSDHRLGTPRVIALTTRRGSETKAVEISADSTVVKPVRGSTMFDSLMNVLHMEATPTRDEEIRPTGSPASRGHILVVEDNAVNQKVALALLRQLGWTADTANDGVYALEALGRRSYDAVLMDCQMPRMDGYETTAEIRRREVGMRTPIVAMTASAMSSDGERCLAVGMDEYLAKPVDRIRLAAVLTSLIGGDEQNDVATAS